MKLYSILLLLFMELALSAQQTNTLILFFDSRSAKLTRAEKQKLDAFLLTNERLRHNCKVSIEGHTDNEGSLAYNQALSDARAGAVRKLLVEKGWTDGELNTSAFAFNRPLADNYTESGKQLNRRVLLTIVDVPRNRATLLGIQTDEKLYTITADASAELSYSSGTRLHIPADAFVYKNGSPVTGSIEVHYTEYRNVGEFMASSIPMSFLDGSHELLQFNSAGMFKIEAFIGDVPLGLAPGKNIDINFKRTGEVEDLGLYRFDETTRTWSLSTAAVSAGQPRVRANSWVSNFAMMNSRGKDTCTLAIDAAVQMAINTGLRLSTDNSAVHYRRAGYHYSDKKRKASFPAKRLLITSLQTGPVHFKVLHVNDMSPNGLQDFEFTYESPDDRPFKEEWKNSFWTDVTINWLRDDEFTMFLTKNSEKVKMDVRGIYKGKVLCDQAFLSLIAQNKIPNLEVYDSFDAYNKKKSSAGIAEQLMNDRCADSLFCFYATSRKWMKNENGESAMDYKTWLDYFNAHKPEMRERYRSLKFQEAGIMAQARIEREKQRLRDSIWVAGQIATMETRDALQTSISITGLGIWNCDQLLRIKDPVMVNKTYLNRGGHGVEPVIVYVIDKNVNGVLTFDGSSGMDPFNFKVGASADNMLLAVDDADQIYLCKQEWFDTALRENSPFLMEPIPKEQVFTEIVAHRSRQ